MKKPIKSTQLKYVSLDRAAKLLELSPDDVLHLGAMGMLQVCADIYPLVSESTVRYLDSPPLDADYLEHMTLQDVVPLANDVLRDFHADSGVALEIAEIHSLTDERWKLRAFDRPCRVKRSNLVITTAEIIRFQDAPAEQQLHTDTDMHPRSRNTLLKLVLGMAMKHYGYRTNNPNGAPTQIEEMLRDFDPGLQVGHQTISNLLREAAPHLSKPH